MAKLKLRTGWTYAITDKGKAVHLVPPPMPMAVCNRIVEIVDQRPDGPLCSICEKRHNEWPEDRKEPLSDDAGE